MSKCIEKSLERFSQIDGVIHTAGMVDSFGILQRRNHEDSLKVLRSKLLGTDHLVQIVNEKEIKLDFIVLFSSLGSIFYKYKFAESAYLAANDYLIARSQRNDNCPYPIFSICWPDWHNSGISQRSAEELKNRYRLSGREANKLLEWHEIAKIQPEEAMLTLEKILHLGLEHSLVSSQEYNTLEHMHQSYDTGVLGKIMQQADFSVNVSGQEYRSSPNKEFNDIEETLRHIWQDLLGCHINNASDFFELGGDSLIALNLLKQIELNFGVDLTITEFLDHSTFAALLDRIKNAQ